MAANFDKSALAWSLPWDADWVTAVSFIGNGRRIAAGNNLGQILVWDLPEKPGGELPKPILRLDGHTNVISRLLSTVDGRWLISSSYDHTIRFWDLQSPAKGSEEIVLNATAILDAEARKNNGAKVPPKIPAKVGVLSSAQVLDAHKEWLSNICLTKDEKFMLSGDDAGDVILWNFPERKEIRRWKTKGWVQGLALSPDAKTAFVSERKPLIFDSGRHASVKLWNAETGQVLKDLEADFKGIHLSSAAFSPDGKTLVLGRTGEGDGKLWIYDSTGKKLKELTPIHQYGVTDVAFHPDGKH
ncbi:MAG: hypothetical protein K8T89_24815, partial [Planctomycetes bacterium]|nr:hypothetical protein [Planctomycetota bacterium]